MKWEYRIIHRKELLQVVELARIGDEGWEMCMVMETSNLYGGFYVYYFKRMKIKEE